MLGNENCPIITVSPPCKIYPEILSLEPYIWTTASPHIQILQKSKYDFKHQSVIISKLILLGVYWENILTRFHSAREEEIFYLKIQMSIITVYFTFYLRQTFFSLPNPVSVCEAV